MVTFEWLPPASWKLKEIKRRGEFSPKLHSSWFSRRSCSVRDPCTQSGAGSRSEAPHTQLGNRAFVQTFGTQDSVQNKKCQALAFHMAQGGPGEYLLTCSLLKNSHLLMQTTTSFLCCFLLGKRVNQWGRWKAFFWYMPKTILQWNYNNENTTTE